MSTKTIVAIGLLAMSLTAAAQSLAEPSNELEAAVSAIVENPPSVSDDVQRSLDAIIEQMKSPEWLRNQSEWRRDIQRLTGTRLVLDTEDQADAPANDTEDRIIIFVSSSMPLTTLRNYASDLQKVNGLMVFRGMLGGMRTIAPTLKLIGNILRINPACEGQRCAMRKTALVIDPILFAEHAVSAVPAAVFVEDMALAPYCERFSEDAVPEMTKHIVYGHLGQGGEAPAGRGPRWARGVAFAVLGASASDQGSLPGARKARIRLISAWNRAGLMYHTAWRIARRVRSGSACSLRWWCATPRTEVDKES